MFQYKVTIIIPVYNTERFLAGCLDSLLAQTIPQGEMEVLMINDGSVDSSGEICARYAEEYSNFKLIEQENKGVSAARNNGIRNAAGKYIMYLDSDDTLSSETVKNVTDFFDEHYEEIDIVIYPLKYEYENGQTSFHWRYEKYLTTTKVYDLNQFPYVAQSTMNICVKNDKRDIFFNEMLSLVEDQLYITMWIERKGQIGYVKEGQYNYKKWGSNNSTVKVSPQFSFDQHNFGYREFLKIGKRNPKVDFYCQSLILYNIDWRIQSDVLCPYHLSGENYDHAWQEFVEIVNQIDSELILNHPKMNEAHKFFLLAQKNNNIPKVKVVRNQKRRCNELVLWDKGGILYANSQVLIVINQCKIEKDTIYLLAYLKDFAFDFTEPPKLFAVLNGEERAKIPLFLSQHSCFWAKMRTNTFWGFSFEMPLDKLKTLEFVVEIQNREFKTKYWLSNKQSVQPSRKRNYIQGSEHTVFFGSNRFWTLPNEDEQVHQAKEKFQRYLFEKRTKQWLVRQYAQKRPGRTIWLYEDTYNAVDNAYYQFQHDIQKGDGIERYYIVDKANLDWKNKFTKEQQKFLVQRKSKKHKRLFIQADKILTSFIGRNDFVPFDQDTILYYWDLFRFEVVYLQHGVMHAELPNMYSKEKIYMIDKVVVSTHFEKENLTKRLAFREKDIICTGMPRFDHLVYTERKKKILFAPSWRVYLVGTDSNGVRIEKGNFAESDYFKEVEAFLKSQQLQGLLKKNSFVLDIKLHPCFNVYATVFKTLCTENIRFVDEVSLGEYSAVLTDFSSFMYDCFYLDVPVITHIFDRDRFKAGLHTYRDLCWSMETEYPLYCDCIEDVLKKMEKIICGEEEILAEFSSYVENIFFDRSQRHAEQLYMYLMQ